MATVAFVRIFLLLVVVQRTKQECSFNRRREFADCDSLQDLYSPDVVLERQVKIENKGVLEELTPIPSERQYIESLEIKESINKLSPDAFKNLSNLTHLYLESNELETISHGFFQNLNLTTLEIFNCRVKSVSKGAFADLPKLEKLLVWSNNLTEISRDIFNNLTVETLSLGGNRIGQIDQNAFADMPNLKQLNLNQNLLEQFNVQDYVSHVGQLTHLSVARNKLTQVTIYMLEGLTNLTEFYLGYNSISTIEPRSFRETPSLLVLGLSHNSLKTLDGSVLPREGLNGLEVLYVSYNQLMYLSTNFIFRLKTLKRVSLEGNPWQCPCLDLVLKWLYDKQVKVQCGMDFFNGTQSVCVVPDSTNICTYSYDDTLAQVFLTDLDKHPKPYCFFL